MDDDPIVRADVRLILEDAGLVGCPARATASKRSSSRASIGPTLVLIGLSRPLADGVESARRILEERDIPTGRSAHRLAARATSASGRTRPARSRACATPVHDEHLVGTVRGAARRPAYPGRAGPRRVERAFSRDAAPADGRVARADVHGRGRGARPRTPYAGAYACGSRGRRARSTLVLRSRALLGPGAADAGTRATTSASRTCSGCRRSSPRAVRLPLHTYAQLAQWHSGLPCAGRIVVDHDPAAATRRSSSGSATAARRGATPPGRSRRRSSRS